MDKLHPFTRSVSHIPLPGRFTYPFHYTPHPLCVEAAEEVQRYLAGCEGADEGKMFGVLVVRAADGTVGFLAAFSGIWAGSYRHAYFVPPVYDLQEPNGFFARGERELDALNRKVRALEEAPALVACRQRLEAEKRQSEQELEALKARMKADKARRDYLRATTTDDATRDVLIRESQFQKAELRRQKQAWTQQLAALQAEAESYEAEIRQLREARKRRSAALQQELFAHFRMRNARGEVRDLCQIFADTDRKVPPAGAGECAAPKLLQYAYLHGLHPLAMAEFWWGCPPKNELRRQGCYYPACKEKCEPILRFMLQGLSVEPNPLQTNASQGWLELEVLYEDDDLMVVHKPAGLLSVPGKLDTDSVWQRIRQSCPDATGPLVVHRLDMATSGLLVVAKTKRVHQNLQAQFLHRTVEKRYVALLDGIVRQPEGEISLPLRPNPADRPRQVVDPVHGKPAVTRYRVLGYEAGGRTRVAFFPQTGRTHQLRVHAAHPSGLDAPIVGDMLYGKAADRLYLHAESLSFTHPVTGERLTIEKAAEF